MSQNEENQDKSSQTAIELLLEPEKDTEKDHLQDIPIDEHVLCKKIDKKILPLLSLSFLTLFLTRINIGNAKLANSEQNASLMQTLSISESMISLIIGIFFVTYVCAEIPVNILICKRFPIGIWIFSMLFFSAILSGACAFARSSTDLMAIRLLMGFVQGGFVSGCVFYLSKWYAPRHLGFRLSIFFSAPAICTAIAGLLAYTISLMNGLLLFGWQWIFLLEAIPAVIVGVAGILWLPSSPERSTFLDSTEKTFIGKSTGHIKAMDSEKQQQSHSPSESKAQIKSAFSDLRTWLFGVLCFCMMTPIFGFAFFVPTLVRNIGYTSWQAQLMSSPPYLLSFICSMTYSRHSDKTGEHLTHMTLGLIVEVLAFGLLSFVLATETSKYLVMMISVASAISVYPIMLAWCQRMIITESRLFRTTALAIITSFGNAAGILAPFLYTFMGKEAMMTRNVRGTSLQDEKSYLILGALACFALITVWTIRFLYDHKRK